jgi:hypothetical protein
LTQPHEKIRLSVVEFSEWANITQDAFSIFKRAVNFDGVAFLDLQIIDTVIFNADDVHGVASLFSLYSFYIIFHFMRESNKKSDMETDPTPPIIFVSRYLTVKLGRKNQP